MDTENVDAIRASECPSCMLPMDAAIMICRRGHSSCNNCKLKNRVCKLCGTLISTMRNYTMENLVEMLSFPCSNTEFGCSEMMTKTHRKEHEANCMFKPLLCKLTEKGVACTWRGIRDALINHAKEKHLPVTWMAKDNLDLWVPSLDYEVQMATAYGELFYVSRKLHSNTVYWSLSLIGSEEKAKGYALLIEFESNKRIVTMTDQCHGETECLLTLIVSDTLINMKKSELENFARNAKGEVWYKVQIHKCPVPENDAPQSQSIEQNTN